MSPVITTIIGAILVFAAGAGLGFWLGSARTKAQAGNVKSEYDAYRAQVAQHFGQAADHFQTIGREYRALYEHMASGAEALCDPEKAEKPISFLPADRSSAVDREDADEAPAAHAETRAESADAATPEQSAEVRSDGPEEKAGDSEKHAQDDRSAAADSDGEEDVAVDQAAVAKAGEPERKKPAEAVESDEETRPDRIYH